MKTTETEATLTHATETPWHVGIKPGPMVYGKWGEQIADCQSTFLDRNEAGHNALLICKAVNSHNALIEALEETETSLSNALHTQDMNEQVKSVFEINLHYIRAALQLVKGGE